MLKKIFKDKKEVHAIELVHEQWIDLDTQKVLFSAGVPIKVHQYIAEHGGSKEIMYRIEILLAQTEWDKMNRKLGSLGIDFVEKTDEG